MVVITGVAQFGCVTLAGDIVGPDASEIRDVAVELVGVGVTDLTVDLSRVTFLGTVGLDALVATDRLLEAVGGRMVLVGANAATWRVFEIARLDRAYHIIPSSLGRRALAQPRGASRRRKVRLRRQQTRL